MFFRYHFLRDSVITGVILYLAYLGSRMLLPNTGVENNSALVFVLAVVVISLFTDGYVFGIAASLASTIFINCFFMLPYGEFNFSLSGYPVAMVSTLTIALIVCTLTSRLKQHAKTAEERERKTKELYKLNAELEKERSAMEIRSAKASTRINILMSVSHDLRTPLTAIAGSASVLLAQNTPERFSQNLELVKGIKEEAEWLSIMVENIISVAKLQDNENALNLKAEVPEEIVESCVIKIKRLFPESTISLNLLDEIVFVYAEPVLIRQVLQNLLENAIRHSGTNGPFQVSTSVERDMVRFAVRDFGVGVPASIIEQIQAGRQVVIERRGDAGRGMGIGISACQSILQAHNSKLQACNKPDGGAEFSFLLKMVTEEMENEQKNNIDCRG